VPDEPTSQDGKEQRKGGGGKGSGKKKEKKLTVSLPPGPAIFASLIEALAKADVGAANRTALEAMVTKLSEASQAEIMEAVPLIKLGKCYDEGTVKILIHMRDRNHNKLIMDSLVQLGAKAGLGKAPAGHVERELSEWLAALHAA
jgi:hypothetical protein